MGLKQKCTTENWKRKATKISLHNSRG